MNPNTSCLGVVASAASQSAISSAAHPWRNWPGKCASLSLRRVRIIMSRRLPCCRQAMVTCTHWPRLIDGLVLLAYIKECGQPHSGQEGRLRPISEIAASRRPLAAAVSVLTRKQWTNGSYRCFWIFFAALSLIIIITYSTSVKSPLLVKI